MEHLQDLSPLSVSSFRNEKCSNQLGVETQEAKSPGLQLLLKPWIQRYICMFEESFQFPVLHLQVGSIAWDLCISDTLEVLQVLMPNKWVLVN